jgi:hypothetical protein
VKDRARGDGEGPFAFYSPDDNVGEEAAITLKAFRWRNAA